MQYVIVNLKKSGEKSHACGIRILKDMIMIIASVHSSVNSPMECAI